LEINIASGIVIAEKNGLAKLFSLFLSDTTEGLQGVGEGWCSYGNSAALKNTVDLEIAPLMIGKSAFEHTRLVEQVRRAAD
jgi:hypothetical protein